MRQLEIEVNKRKGGRGNCRIRVLKQTHRGNNFGRKGDIDVYDYDTGADELNDDGYIFNTFNGISLRSVGGIEWIGGNKILYVRGDCHEMDNEWETVSYKELEEIQKAIREYNTYYCVIKPSFDEGLFEV